MRENFSEKLSAEDEKRLAAMVLDHPIQAIKDLQDLTNCSLSEGKMWVDNKREEIFQESLPPCPFCGNKLRTPAAKQCRFCKRDWHDENDLKWLR